MKIFVPLTAVGVAVALIAVTIAATGYRSARPTADASATESNITRVVATLLEHSQFAHHPLDNELAGKFLDGYLDALDGSRVLFLQSDVTEFNAYRAGLAQAILRKGDTSLAGKVFDRFIERLDQRAAYFTNTLRTASFEFTGHDMYSTDREHAARPADLDAAQSLWSQQLRADYLQEKLAGKQPAAIIKTLDDRYTQQMRTMREMNQDDIIQIYLNALAHVYDPHSDYMGREEMESFSIAMDLSLCGIGASLEPKDGYCTIRDLVPGGPAARNGSLKPGDRIIAVAEAGKNPVSIVDMPLSHAVELIRGPKGSVVHLTVIPAGAGASVSKTVTLVREQIKLTDQEASARLVDWPQAVGRALRIGIINLPSFYADMAEESAKNHRSASADVAELLRKLKAENISGVVLDLRQNGGGSLEEAINLTGLFIPRGPVVQTRDADGNVSVGTSDDSKPLYTGPLVLLTSRYSASASEIVAGALQDYGRALIVGDPSTFGKGTVQDLLSLIPVFDRLGLGYAFDPGALKVTIRKFYRPSGASTQLRGVASDIVVPTLSAVSGVSESALQDPLPWDTVTRADFKSLNLVQAYLPALRQESARRMDAEKQFAYLRQEIALVKTNLDSKAVSLNEAERRSELAQEKRIRAEYEKEVRSLRSTVPPSYEITLENAKLPGLPSPLQFTNSVPAASTQADDLTAGAETLAPAQTPGSPSNDIILTEAEHILADYVALLNHQPAEVEAAKVDP